MYILFYKHLIYDFIYIEKHDSSERWGDSRRVKSKKKERNNKVVTKSLKFKTIAIKTKNG